CCAVAASTSPLREAVASLDLPLWSTSTSTRHDPAINPLTETVMAHCASAASGASAHWLRATCAVTLEEGYKLTCPTVTSAGLWFLNRTTTKEVAPTETLPP